MEINGTLSHADDYTIDRNGELYLWSGGKSVNEDTGHFRFINISIRSRGKLVSTGFPSSNLPRVTMKLTRLVVNGGGTLSANDLKIETLNITIDVAGLCYLIGFIYFKK
jgi:hypothetical protein